MSFDRMYPRPDPPPKKYPYSKKICKRMGDILENYYSEKLIDNLKNSLENDEEISERVVLREEMLEMKEIEMEQMRMIRFFGVWVERMDKKSSLKKYGVMFVWICCIAIFGYYYSNYYEYFHSIHVFNDLTYVVNIGWAYIFGSYIRNNWRYAPPPPPDKGDEEIKGRYKLIKKNVKPISTMKELVEEQRQLIELFLNEYIPMARKCDSSCLRKHLLACLNALPVFLFLFYKFWCFAIKGHENRNANKEFGDCIIVVLFGSLLLPPFLWGFV